MADGCAPVLIHCSVGKDRTGLFAALTLTVLGVPFEAVIADYLRSTEALSAGPLRARLVERASDAGGIEPTDDIMDEVLGVKADYLEIGRASCWEREGKSVMYSVVAE